MHLMGYRDYGRFGRWQLELDGKLAVEREAVIEALGTKDAEEGVAAFLEKRDPEWQGE